MHKCQETYQLNAAAQKVTSPPKPRDWQPPTWVSALYNCFNMFSVGIDIRIHGVVGHSNYLMQQSHAATFTLLVNEKTQWYKVAVDSECEVPDIPTYTWKWSVASPTGWRWQAAVWCGPVHPARGMYSSGPRLTGPTHDHQLHDSSWMDLFVYVTISELWDLSPTVPVTIGGSVHTATHTPAGPPLRAVSGPIQNKSLCTLSGLQQRHWAALKAPCVCGMWCSFKSVNGCNSPSEVAVILFLLCCSPRDVLG